MLTVAVSLLLVGTAVSHPAHSEKHAVSFVYRETETSLGFPDARNGRQSRTIQGCDCGKVNRKNRIVGGEETEVHEYPWQALLNFWIYNETTKSYNNYGLCGGTIINDLYILTAAHCAEYKVNVTSANGTTEVTKFITNVTEMVVYLQDHHRNKSSDNQIWAKVAEFIKHPQYAGRSYDFMLLKLKNRIDFPNSNGLVRPVCMPQNASNTYEDELATATGWGQLSENSKNTSETLQEVQLLVISNEKCSKYYAMNSSMICAGWEEGGEDTCKGDSGGPLVIGGGENFDKFTLIGVTSGGIGCGRPDQFAIYGRVTTVLDWINQNTQGANTCK